LAEDPPAFGEVYMLKYIQIFIYFILFSTRAKNTSHHNTTPYPTPSVSKTSPHSKRGIPIP
jgi:hypothetical protein